MRIAPATPADVPALARLMASSPLLARYHVTFESAVAALNDAFTNGDVVLLARDDEVLGLCWLSFAPRVLNDAAYLRLLLVSESAHGRGIGTALLIWAEGVCRARSKHLYLLATTDNSGARRFYERHGYRHIGDLPGLVWPDLDEALYWKRLAPQQGTPDEG